MLVVTAAVFFCFVKQIFFVFHNLLHLHNFTHITPRQHHKTPPGVPPATIALLPSPSWSSSCSSSHSLIIQCTSIGNGGHQLQLVGGLWRVDLLFLLFPYVFLAFWNISWSSWRSCAMLHLHFSLWPPSHHHHHHVYVLIVRIIIIAASAADLVAQTTNEYVQMKYFIFCGCACALLCAGWLIWCVRTRHPSISAINIYRLVVLLLQRFTISLNVLDLPSVN